MNDNLMVLGIHHVTAMVTDPQKNLDFYVEVLGLRLVKKTINFDAPNIYHFYYGDETGSPGSVFTTFPFLTGAKKGRKGSGQLTVTSFSAPIVSLDFWVTRLKKMNIEVNRLEDRFGDKVISFPDPDELDLEIIFSDKEGRSGWNNGSLPQEHSLRGFHSVTLSVNGYENTAKLMTETLGFRKINEHINRFRFEAGVGGPGFIVDILCQPDLIPGSMGAGIVHHVAWQIKDDESQKLMQKKLQTAGMNVTPVMDRNYFNSIYFLSPGGVLFEVATNPPGFLIDETKDSLGSHLKLPSWLEKRRDEIERVLPKVNLPGKNGT